MKYTRYDLKGKKNNLTIIVIIIFLLILLAYLIGTIFFDVFIKDKGDMVNKTESKFVFIQCGLYGNKDNAIKLSSKVDNFGSSFIVEEDKKSRVLLGIYSEEKAKEVSDKLLKEGIENVKITYTINQNDLCDKEIIEIINADVKILAKLSEEDVKAIQTAELKKWISGLGDVSGKERDSKLLGELKDYNNNLPKELDRDKAVEVYSYIYNFLNKMEK